MQIVNKKLIKKSATGPDRGKVYSGLDYADCAPFVLDTDKIEMHTLDKRSIKLPYAGPLPVEFADIEYDDLAHVYEIPGGNLSPNSIEDLEAPFQPHGYARERFAYLSWPVEMRKKYISSSADSRREMIAAAYARG